MPHFFAIIRMMDSYDEFACNWLYCMDITSFLICSEMMAILSLTEQEKASWSNA